MPREIITLACTDCKRKNYQTTRNKKAQQGRLELKQFCRFEQKHTLHREVK